MGFAYLPSCQLEESFKIQASNVGSIQIVDDVVDELVYLPKTQTHESVFELQRINQSTAITVENIKSLFDLLDLFKTSIVVYVVLSSPWLRRLHSLIIDASLGFLIDGRYWFTFGCAHMILNNKDQQSSFLYLPLTTASNSSLRISYSQIDQFGRNKLWHMLPLYLQQTFMIKSRISIEKEFHRNTLLQALRLASERITTNQVYFQGRAHEIARAILEESDIFGTGLTLIHSRNHPPQSDIDGVVVVAILGDSAITQIERYLHLFKVIFIVNLSISGSDIKQSMKVSPIRLKTKGFYQINLNFLPFIDSVYYTSNLKRETQAEQQVSFSQSLTSFLVSLPRFHEFQIQILEKSTPQQLGDQIKASLQSKLSVLQKHGSKAYSPQSSPRVRLLVLDRKIDQMSPLLYSYHFGPIAKQIEAFDRNNHKFTSNSAIYRSLFSLDIQEAGALLANISQQKSSAQKMKYQLSEFDKAKKAISSQYDQNTSIEEIKIQIEVLDSVKQFCKRRVATTALQQTIVNGISQQCQKMSPAKVVDRIIEWSDIPLQDLKPSKEDYIKILVLSYMVSSFWFWHRRIINAGLQGPHKQRVISFCKKVEGKFVHLKQKAQGEERLDLYRHQPVIVSTVKKWLVKPDSIDVIKLGINESSINRESKVVVAINGALGYGELAMLLSELGRMEKGEEVIVFSETLVTTKEYLELLIKLIK